MIVNDHGCYLDEHPYHFFDESLAKELSKFFMKEVASVVDLGCGNGDYVWALRMGGTDCDGYDGNPNTHINSKCLCFPLDLAVPVNIPVYSWVLSLEVGEHIPKEYQDIYIDNLHRHNRKGIICSWAVPGQTGESHVNELPNSTIKEIFAKLGYTNDMETETTLRLSATYGWFRGSIMVFRRNNEQ